MNTQTVRKTITLSETSELGRAGQVITLELIPQDVHYAQELSTFLAGYHPAGFRGDEASPPVLVDKDEDRYRIFDADDALLDVPCEGALDADIPTVSVASALTKYSVVDRFIGSFISDRVLKNQSAIYDARVRAAKRIGTIIQLRREVTLWGSATSLLRTAGSWTNKVTCNAGTKWNGGATSDPIANLHYIVEQALLPPNRVFMSRRVFHTFIRHASVKDYMRQMLGDAAPSDAQMGAQMDVQLPGLPLISVVDLKYRSTPGGTTDYVVGNDAVCVHVPPGVPTDGEDVATSYTFRRRDDQGVGYAIREFRIEGKGPTGGTMVVGYCADVPKLTAEKTGGLIVNAYL